MIRSLLILMIIGFFLALGLGFLGYIHPALDTFSNFRIHFSLVLVIFIGALILAYNIKLALIFSLVVVSGITFVVVSQGSHHRLNEQNDPIQTTYSLLHLNLFYQNTTPEKVLDLVAHNEPDIILFNEMSDEWKQYLVNLDLTYPHTYYCPEWQQIGGSRIYSRLPMKPGSGYCHAYSAMALMDITIGDQPMTLGSVHLRWPWPASGPKQVDSLEPVLRKLGNSALIAGDFNSVTWSWLVRRFAQYGKLTTIDGIGPTWFHQYLPISWVKLFGLPIDHVMIKGNIDVIEARTLEAVGSDHLPVLVRFSITK